MLGAGTGQEASEANALVALDGCFFTVSNNKLFANGLGVSRLGTATDGYLFGAPGTPPASATATTALDVDSSATPQGYFEVVNPTCVTTGFLHHNALLQGGPHVQPWTGKPAH